MPGALAVGTYSAHWFTRSADDGESASGPWKFTYDPSRTEQAGEVTKSDEDESSRRGTVITVAAGALVVLTTDM